MPALSIEKNNTVLNHRPEANSGFDFLTNGIVPILNIVKSF